MTFLYPPNLLGLIKEAWASPSLGSERERPSLPPDEALAELLGIAYQASLLKEEGRRLSFRIIVLARNAEYSLNTPYRQSRIAKFTDARALSIAELRRLAPAADSIRTMICVDRDAVRGWLTWALLDTGANWWAFTRHEASGGQPPPDRLSIGSQGPGELTISCSGWLLLALRNGAVYKPNGSAFNVGPINKHLEPGRRALYKQAVHKVNEKKWDKDGNDDDYPKRFHDMCLSRILTAICDLSHGGTLIVVPDELNLTDARLTDRINIKHACEYDYAWDLMLKHLELHWRYFSAYFTLDKLDASVDPKAFWEMHHLNILQQENEEALTDCFRFIASLSSVDGALVMTDRFRVLGFGAEVIAQSPTLRDILIAMNPAGTETKSDSIESYGTRHRSAFRICSSYNDAMAFIVSTDGGIKATKRIGANVMLWPEVQAGFWGM